MGELRFSALVRNRRNFQGSPRPSLHSSSLLLFDIKLEMTLDIRTTVMTGTPYHASTTC